MSRATFFMRECPTCGRRLQIRVEYLGRAVRCKHCDRQFVACDPTIAHADSGDSLLDRANHLLESYDLRRYHPH